MNGKSLDSILRESADSLINKILDMSNFGMEVSAMQQSVYNALLAVTDTLLDDNIMLDALLHQSSIRKGVSMQFDEIVQWWQKQNLKTADDLATVLDNFKIVFACNSNGIEGSSIDYHTTRAVFEGSTLPGFSGTAKEIFETQNQKFAFDYFAKAFEDELDIDMHMILKLHSIMMYGCYDETRWRKGERPGKFKKGDYCVGVDDVGSFPDEVETDLQELLDEMNDNDLSGDVLIKAAYLHVVFETIHPFADGNGRVGRTLMNYYLIRHNYPPIVIFNEDKETYYLALEVYNKTGKLSGFVKFLQEQMVKTWERKLKNRRGIENAELKKLSAFL